MTAGGEHLLDTDTSRATRDTKDSDDIDALESVGSAITEAIALGSWESLLAVSLLARHDDDALDISEREHCLNANLSSIARITERFVTRLGERTDLLPVGRVRRPARRAIQRLTSHTEDWAALTLAGPQPRRALAVTREEDADLYENRMVTELIHPILSGSLSQRIRYLKRLHLDLADLSRARDEGTHYRRDRLYRFWGDGLDLSESSSQVSETLTLLERLHAWVQALRGSTLATTLRDRRTGLRSLRTTNVIANDRHYRAAGQVWRAYERPLEDDESADDRLNRLMRRHNAFDDYVLALLIRALSDLGYAPDDYVLPTPERPLTLKGGWGSATLTRHRDGTVTVTSNSCRTRFVPLLDLVSLDDDQQTIEDRWSSIVHTAPVGTVIIHLAASAPLRTLSFPTASQLVSAGNDGIDGTKSTSAVPVTPLETTSLERVSRALALAVLAPRLLAYPEPIRLGEANIPRRVIDHLESADLADPRKSPLFHRVDPNSLALRRPATPSEERAIEDTIRKLSDRTKAPGWERDLRPQISSLGSAIRYAGNQVRDLLCCPQCHERNPPDRLLRDGDVFSVTCFNCNARWGLERCGNCHNRIPVLEPVQQLVNPEVTGPGWVERVFGQDALASPCWARATHGRYICPSCRACSLSADSEGQSCTRCHAIAHRTDAAE